MQQGIKLRHKWQWFLLVFWFSAGFPIRVQLVGDILGKMAKNYMKFTKSTFLRQNSGWDIVRKSQFFGNVGGIPPAHPTRGNPALVRHHTHRDKHKQDTQGPTDWHTYININTTCYIHTTATCITLNIILTQNFFLEVCVLCLLIIAHL